MATASTQSTGSGILPYRLTVGQFLKMIEAGIFPEKAHVELLGGIPVDKMTKHDPHDFGVARLGGLLRLLIQFGWFVLEEKAIVLGRFDRPEPDVVVVRGSLRDIRHAPRPREIALIAEVCDSSDAKDRGPKWWRYAASRIPTYWIVNLPRMQVEVHTSPSGRGRTAIDRDCRVYGREDEVPVDIDGQSLGRIAVKELLI